ncbi:hypothetical protein ACFQQB_47545 [Nonomuraea rubra]
MGAAGAPAGGFGGAGQGATEVFHAAPGGPGGAPPRAGDTAVFQAADLEPDPPSGPNRKLIIQLGVAVVVIAAVTVGMVLWAGRRDMQAPVAESTPTAEATTPSATPTTLPPTPDPSPGLVITAGPGQDSDEEPDYLRETSIPKATLGEAIPPGGYAKWLQEFDKALMAQQSMGGINPQVAGKAREKIRKAARKFGEGKPDATLSQIADVYRDLARARERGDMAPEGPAVSFMEEWRLPTG